MQAVNNLNKSVVIAVAVIAVIAAIAMGVYFLKGSSTAAGTITANDKPEYVKQLQAGQKPVSYGQQYGQGPQRAGQGGMPYGGPGRGYGGPGGYGGAPR